MTAMERHDGIRLFSPSSHHDAPPPPRSFCTSWTRFARKSEFFRCPVTSYPSGGPEQPQFPDTTCCTLVPRLYWFHSPIPYLDALSRQLIRNLLLVLVCTRRTIPASPFFELMSRWQPISNPLIRGRPSATFAGRSSSRDHFRRSIQVSVFFSSISPFLCPSSPSPLNFIDEIFPNVYICFPAAAAFQWLLYLGARALDALMWQPFQWLITPELMISMPSCGYLSMVFIFISTLSCRCLSMASYLRSCALDASCGNLFNAFRILSS